MDTKDIERRLLDACRTKAQLPDRPLREQLDAYRAAGTVEMWSLRLYAPERMVELMKYLTDGEARLFAQLYSLPYAEAA